VWRRKWGAFRGGGTFRTAELRQWGRAVRLLSSRAEIITYFQARRCSGFNPSSRLMDNFHQSSPRQSLNDPPRTDQSRSGLSNRVSSLALTTRSPARLAFSLNALSDLGVTLAGAVAGRFFEDFSRERAVKILGAVMFLKFPSFFSIIWGTAFDIWGATTCTRQC
jgi:hypothetical protein